MGNALGFNRFQRVLYARRRIHSVAVTETMTITDLPLAQEEIASFHSQ